MAKISSVRNFQYKIVKNVVLSILIPASIILFSGWFFFGGIPVKPYATTSTSTAIKTATNNADSCKGMTKDTCKPDACVWDPTQNTCLGAK
jgi:hypothetical protein